VRKILLVVFVCGLMAAFAPSLQAETFGQAFNAAYVGQTLGNGPFTLGWSFNVTSTITVDDLAVYHVNGVPLLESHDVGIWDAAGNLLVSATVPAGLGECDLDQMGFQEWCTADVSLTVLKPGTYTIGATWNNLLDPMIFPGQVGNVNGPNVAFIQNQYLFGAGLNDPTNTTGDGHSYFGPNFEYSSTTTPEPGTMLMFGTGVIGLAGVIRRKINM
jgi:hypothetical protein